MPLPNISASKVGRLTHAKYSIHRLSALIRKEVRNGQRVERGMHSCFHDLYVAKSRVRLTNMLEYHIFLPHSFFY